MRWFFNKHKYIKVVKFNSDKSAITNFYKRGELPKTYIINPDHVFNSNGYSTIVMSDKSAESINPLNFESKYDVAMYKSAINNKMIADTFSTLKTSKFDLQQILLFLSLATNFIVLYFVLKSQGIL